MKKNLLLVSSIVLGFFFAFFLLYKNQNRNSEILTNDQIVKSHSDNLSKSPFKETLKLTKEERKSAGLPPNKYFEEEYELTISEITQTVRIQIPDLEIDTTDIEKDLSGSFFCSLLEVNTMQCNIENVEYI